MRYCFYSGYADLKGGYTTLLISLITGLVNKGEQVVLINYNDGLIVRELNKNNIHVTILDIDHLNKKNVSNYIFPTDILIISKFHEYFNLLMEVNPTICYYDINDFITDISSYKFGLKFYFLSQKLIFELLNKKALWFMDDTGPFNIKSKFDFEIQESSLLPIPVSIPYSENQYLLRHNKEPGTIEATYIGRSVNWKLSPLEKVLSDCSRLQKHILFYILVDDKNELERLLPIKKYESATLEIKIFENYPPSEIESFLINHSDLHFGMGTAALHGAILGIPTILIDASENKFPEDYSYSWLYETQDYCLGRFIEKRGFRKGKPLGEIFDHVTEINSKIEISEKTFEYVVSNHKLEIVVDKLLKLASQSQFHLQDAQPYVPYYFKTHKVLKKLFSIK